MNEIERVARAVHEELSHINIMAYLDMPTDTAERVATAAIAAMRGEPVGWQPIETAPKDGTEIFLHCPGSTRPKIGSWRVDGLMSERGEMWLDDSYDDFSTSFESCPLDPTHWMPLPTPPDSGKD